MTNGVQTIDFPTVKIGGKTYTLKFDFVAQYQADELGLDPGEAIKAFSNTEDKTPGKIAMLMKLFAAMVAHNFIELDETPPTPSKWALRLSKEPKDVHRGIGEAVVQAILKALPVPTTEKSEAPAEPATIQGAPN